MSPLLSEKLGHFPSTFIQVTKNEILYFDSIEFSKALEEQGAEVKLDISDKLYHSWQMVPDYLKEAKDSLIQIGEFILGQARL